MKTLLQSFCSTGGYICAQSTIIASNYGLKITRNLEAKEVEYGV